MKKRALVIFGSTGDLALKKLLPALEALEHKKVPPFSSIITIGRKNMNTAQYCKKAVIHSSFHKKIHYVCLTPETEKNVRSELALLKKKNGIEQFFIYLALPFYLFESALKEARKAGVLTSTTCVAFEKPFGHNLASARALNKAIMNDVPEERIYRVDHYLGKEMVESLLTIRKTNPFLKAIWNNTMIDHIDLRLIEKEGLEGRGAYYDKTGALCDVVQNHLLQIAALILMEEPSSLAPTALHAAKARVIRSIAAPHVTDIVRGQYKGYRNEPQVASRSKTETFVAFRTHVRMQRWKNVPLTIRAGKGLNEHTAEARLVLKHQKGQPSTTVTIQFSPESGLSLNFNLVPHAHRAFQPIDVAFSEKKVFCANTPQAYEEIFHSFVNKEKQMFVSFPEIEASWKLTDTIAARARSRPLHIYKPGTSGPRLVWTDEKHL